MIWSTREEKNIKSEHQEEKIIQTNKDRIRNFWDNSKWTNPWVIRVPEEEEEQEIENLFEKIMEKNFPNLVEEIHIQLQEAQNLK